MQNLNDYIIINKKPNIIWANNKIINDRINSNHYKVSMIYNIENINNCGFTIKKIKDIVKVNRRGIGLNGTKNDNIPNYKVRNLTNFGINYEPDLISNEDYIKNKRCHIENGDVLLASTGVGSLGKVDIFYNNAKATADGHITILRVKDGLDSGYLKEYLQSKYGQFLIEQNTLGSTGQTELYPKDIDEFIIPIPSPEIQKYIGDKVRKAEELREEAKRLKDEAEEMLLDNLSFTIEDFHKKNNSKYVWVGNTFLYDRIDCQYYDALYEYIEKKLKKNKCVALIDLCIDYSITVPYSTDFGQRSNDNIYPMYRVKNIIDYIINTEDLVFMNCKYYNSNENCRVFAGDILLSRVGSIGRACIYMDNKNASMGQNVTRIRLKDNINKYYFLCYINSQISRLLMQRETNAGLQSNITNENIKELMIPILERSIQDEIGNKILKYIQISNQIKQLIKGAKKDVEDLIEGNFDMSKAKKDL